MSVKTTVGEMLNSYDAIVTVSEELSEEVYMLQLHLDGLNTSFVKLKSKRQALETFVNKLGEELSELFPEEKK